jgi:hypothetical protein
MMSSSGEMILHLIKKYLTNKSKKQQQYSSIARIGLALTIGIPDKGREGVIEISVTH